MPKMPRELSGLLGSPAISRKGKKPKKLGPYKIAKGGCPKTKKRSVVFNGKKRPGCIDLRAELKSSAVRKCKVKRTKRRKKKVRARKKTRRRSKKR